jgi:hypothetical protein
MPYTMLSKIEGKRERRRGSAEGHRRGTVRGTGERQVVGGTHNGGITGGRDWGQRRGQRHGGWFVQSGSGVKRHLKSNLSSVSGLRIRSIQNSNRPAAWTADGEGGVRVS